MIKFNEQGILTSSTIPFVVDLIPKSNTTSRPQNKMTPESLTIHNTGNPNADAEDNSEFVDNTKAYTSWTFTIGDGIVFQELPIYENGWHAGDGVDGKGNRTSIGIEISEKEGDKAYETAIVFIAELLKYFDWDVETHVFAHKYWSGKYCPRLILPIWSTDFIPKIKEEMEKGGDDMTEERVSIKIKLRDIEVHSIEKESYTKLKPFLMYHTLIEEQKPMYEYCGKLLEYGIWRDEDVGDAQRALDKIGFSLDIDENYGNDMVDRVKDFQGIANIDVTGEIDEETAIAINKALLALSEDETDSSTVSTPKPIETPVEPVVDVKDALYNKAIPQLVYKGVIDYNKTSFIKTNQMLYIQRALQSLGYYREFDCDKKRGNGTIQGIKDLKTEMGLSAHYNKLTEDDIFKINRKLILDFHKYHDGKYGTESWNISKNSTYTSVVVKINPSRLDIVIRDKAGVNYTEADLITSSYQWYDSKVRTMYKYGISIAKGKLLLDGQVHNKPCMTLFSKGGKHFDVKTVLTAKELGTSVKFADAGLEVYPNSSANLLSGFIGKFADVVRQTKRPYNFKLDEELYFGVHPSMSNKTAGRMGKAMKLGWINTWDAGGSTLLKIAGVWYYTTTRRLYQLIKF